jgi:glycosyltransferase involved in cell wall biosynthesis
MYNEERTIATVLERVLALGRVLKEVIVVDDGSTDDSAAVVESVAATDSRVRFFQLERNQGKTAAVRYALEQARGEVVIIQDADLEYDPAEIPDVIAPILNGHADVVYGSRFLAPRADRGQYLTHYLANVSLTFLSNLLTQRGMTDMETGYKAFRAGVIKPLRLTSRGFGLEVEITALISRTNARTCEVPISYHSRGYKDGKKIGFTDGVMAGLYILWFNLVQPWFASARRYRSAVNSYLERRQQDETTEIVLPEAA